jgi:hypothetical protein
VLELVLPDPQPVRTRPTNRAPTAIGVRLFTTRPAPAKGRSPVHAERTGATAGASSGPAPALGHLDRAK